MAIVWGCYAIYTSCALTGLAPVYAIFLMWSGQSGLDAWPGNDLFTYSTMAWCLLSLLCRCVCLQLEHKLSPHVLQWYSTGLSHVHVIIQLKVAIWNGRSVCWTKWVLLDMHIFLRVLIADKMRWFIVREHKVCQGLLLLWKNFNQF